AVSAQRPSLYGRQSASTFDGIQTRPYSGVSTHLPYGARSRSNTWIEGARPGGPESGVGTGSSAAWGPAGSPSSSSSGGGGGGARSPPGCCAFAGKENAIEHPRAASATPIPR